MASQQPIVSTRTRTWVRLVGLEQDADIQMLNCCTLKALKMLCSRVCASSKASVDPIDDVAGCELSLHKGNALVDQLKNLGLISESGCPLVSTR
jgi:hypothetical protein